MAASSYLLICESQDDDITEDNSITPSHSHIHKRPGCLILVLYVFTTSYRIQGTSRASCVAALAEERKESKYGIDRCQKSQRFLIFWLRISIKLFTEACSCTPS